MGLLQDIIAEATSASCDPASLLRKTLVLAVRLKNSELRQWVEHELNGYAGLELDQIPAYRRHEVVSYGHFADQLVGQVRLQIPASVLPEDLRKRFRFAAIGQSIPQLAEMLRSCTESGTPQVELPWPMGAYQFAQKISPLECISAWRELPASCIAGTMDAIKTRILSVALDLEDADPAAGDVPSTQPKISESEVNQIINNHIHGPVHNLAAGSTNVTQIVVQNGAGDIDSLLATLRKAGLQEEDLHELQEALAEDKKENVSAPEPGIGSKVKAWLGGLQFKASAGTLATDVAGGVIAQAISKYLGIN